MSSLHLNSLKHPLLELPLNLLSILVCCRLAVQSHEGTEVELGGLQELDLADVNLEEICQYYWARKLTDLAVDIRSGEGRCPG